MSMIYCHKHDRHVDTDYHEDCPECLAEIDRAFEELEPLRTARLIPNSEVHHKGQMWDPGSWSLVARSVTEAGAKVYTMPERDHGKWYVVYQSTNMLKIMEDAIELAQGTDHFEYAVGTPNV